MACSHQNAEERCLLPICDVHFLEVSVEYEVTGLEVLSPKYLLVDPLVDHGVVCVPVLLRAALLEKDGEVVDQ